jgi:hypothetical protein
VHPFFLYEIQRQHMAEWERNAALHRMFMEDQRALRRERKRRRRSLLRSVIAPRRVRHTVRTDAVACR